MYGFYVGSFFVASFATPVQQDWLFPNNLEHARETSNVEDLNINPEDIVLFPLEVQAGSSSYTRITFSSIPDFYLDGLGEDSGFYFTLYTDSGFYFIDTPGLGGFYVSGTEVPDFYAITPSGTGGFYVNYDNIVDFYVGVVPGVGGFYIGADIRFDTGFYLLLVDN